MGEIKKIEDAVAKGQTPNVSEIKRYLLEHANFEDNFFYPKLDEELDDNLKNVIFDRAKEIIRG